MRHAKWLIGPALAFTLAACGQQVPGAVSSASVDERVTAQHVGFCVYTQGYYKNHPAAYEAALQRYSSYGISWSPNDQFFNSSYTWGNILHMKPKGGDAYLILAHQFATAVANGLWREWPETNFGVELWEDTEISDVQTAYRRARFFFEGIDPFNEGAINPTRSELIHWASILDKFNNGLYADAMGRYRHCDKK